MKKLLAVLCAVTAIAACATGCAKNSEAGKPTTVASSEAVQTSTVSQSSVSQADYKTVYLEKLDSLQKKYLAGEKQSSAEENENSDNPRIPGIIFADLFYFDKDDTPELFIAYNYKNNDPSISVYTMEGDACKELLNEKVMFSYGYLDASRSFYFTYDNDNNLALRVDNSNEYKYLNEKYYTLTENGLNTVKLFAESSVGGWGEGENSGPVEPDKYEIDGEECEKADFKAKEAELHRDESVYVDIAYLKNENVEKNLDTLRGFLSGNSNQYESLSGGYYSTNLKEVAWTNNVNFLFSAK